MQLIVTMFHFCVPFPFVHTTDSQFASTGDRNITNLTERWSKVVLIIFRCVLWSEASCGSVPTRGLQSSKLKLKNDVQKCSVTS